MRYWLIGDTHFGHTLLEDEGHRPKGFGDVILRNLAQTEFRNGDTLIHLGDFCIGSDDDHHQRFESAAIRNESGWVSRVLVRGNHDSKSLSWYSERWDFVCDEFRINYMGHKIVFTHAPRPVVEPGVVVVHGHAHQTLPYGRYEMPMADSDVHCHFRLEGENAQDVSRLRPILLKTFLKQCRLHRRERDG